MSFNSSLKRFMRGTAVARVAASAIEGYIRLVHSSSRWRKIGWEHFEKVDASESGFILAFWHQDILMAPTVRPETAREVYMLISTHADGEIIANAVAPFGISFIRGSAANRRKKFKEKSGAPALLQMAAALREGGVVGVTPDGPRGPARRAQPGPVKLAAMTGAPILPAAYAAAPAWRLGTWDKFRVPIPFARGAYAVSAPVPAPENSPEAVANAQRALEAGLNAASDAAEIAVGRSPETPASE